MPSPLHPNRRTALEVVPYVLPAGGEGSGRLPNLTLEDYLKEPGHLRTLAGHNLRLLTKRCLDEIKTLRVELLRAQTRPGGAQ